MQNELFSNSLGMIFPSSFLAFTRRGEMLERNGPPVALFSDKRREKEVVENRIREAEIDKSPQIEREIEKTKQDKKRDLRVYREN